MGLWISKQIMELHGGCLKADSAGIGRGSTFSLEMPVDIDTDDALLIPTTSNSLNAAETSNPGIIVPICNQSGTINGSFGERVRGVPTRGTAGSSSFSNRCLAPLRILVCDVSAPTRKVLCRLFESKGQTCLNAADGMDDVEHVRCSLDVEAEALDVVLIDDQMPNLDGCSACRVIRYHNWNHRKCTEELSNFITRGADRSLAKPVSSELLFDTIRDILESKRVDEMC